MRYEVIKRDKTRDKTLLRVQAEHPADVSVLCFIGSSLRDSVAVEFISGQNPSLEIDLIGLLKYTVKI